MIVQSPSGDNSAHPLGNNNYGPYSKNFPSFKSSTQNVPPNFAPPPPKENPSNYSPGGIRRPLHPPIEAWLMCIGTDDVVKGTDGS